MTELLSREEYTSIAESMTFPIDPFINGEFRKPLAGKTMETINPATGEVLAVINVCDAADVDVAVVAAREAFEAGVWSQKSPSERKAVLLKLADLIEENKIELAVLESLESGKPISDCHTIDLHETINTIRWHAEAADKMFDQMTPAQDGSVGMIVREPVGVVAGILPWNFPLITVAMKIAPALASGNSMLLKPAEQTSMTALRVGELAHEAGVPAGVLNILPGLGPDVGEPMSRHEGIEAISFTGSTETGRLVLENSATSNLKKVTLECGGKSPCVVLSDADDLDVVAETAVIAALWNMGQNCTANSRLIVHKDLAATLLEKVKAQFQSWKTGDPLDPNNQLGAINSREQFDKIQAYQKSALDEGAELVLGGNTIGNANQTFLEPTLYAGVTPDMTIAQEEIFGPVLAIIVAQSDDEALEIANDTTYGLQASLFTSNLTKAHKYARAIRAGTVTVNCYGEGDVSTPFGGYKLSGFGGRDKSFTAHDQYTETKTIWVDLSADPKA